MIIKTVVSFFTQKEWFQMAMIIDCLFYHLPTILHKIFINLLTENVRIY